MCVLPIKIVYHVVKGVQLTAGIRCDCKALVSNVWTSWTKMKAADV